MTTPFGPYADVEAAYGALEGAFSRQTDKHDLKAALERAFGDRKHVKFSVNAVVTFTGTPVEVEILHASKGEEGAGDSATVFFCWYGRDGAEKQFYLIALGQHAGRAGKNPVYQLIKPWGQAEPPFKSGKLVYVDGQGG